MFHGVLQIDKADLFPEDLERKEDKGELSERAEKRNEQKMKSEEKIFEIFNKNQRGYLYKIMKNSIFHKVLIG